MRLLNANQGKPVAIAFLRLSLAVGLLSAVSDRFGLWGPYGHGAVAWGSFPHFLAYTARLNPWLPHAFVPAVGWTVTVAESVLGLALLTGFQVPKAAFFAGCLLLLFAIAMSLSLGIQAPLNYSVFIAAASAFVLATL